MFDKIKVTLQNSRQFLQKTLEEYIMFSSQARQLALKQKTVLLLCQQAVSKVEQLKSLQPDATEGLIAIIELEHKQIQAKVHFTPDKITLYEDFIEGQLRLLNPPQFQTDSLVYRYLIASWKIFLGGKLPTRALPDNIRLENDKVYYTLPRNQLQVLDDLFFSLETDSVLTTSLKRGELIIECSVALSWNKIKLQNFLQLLKSI